MNSHLDSEGTIETFIILLTGHLIGDFLLQSKKMVKSKTKPQVLFGHTLLVTASTATLLGAIPILPLAILMIAHAVIDIVKAKSQKDNVLSFVIDQSAHILLLAVMSALFPNMGAEGYWSAIMCPEQWKLVLNGYTLISGLVLSLRVGELLISKATKNLLTTEEKQEIGGLKDGGKYIGWLERTLISILVFAGMTDGFGFLIAAKSILRFSEIKDTKSRALVEYVIIGTFMSFGWGLLITLLTRLALRQL